MITDHDNRLQFPPTLIDFDNVVGITGQTHDTYPSAGSQPRYDYQRMMHIALLACQSSNNPPTQFRIGTLWYCRSKKSYFVWNGTAWVSLTEAIAVSEDSSGVVTSLATLLTNIEQKLLAILPRMTFSGYCTSANKTNIPIPSTVQTALTNIAASLRPTVYINGGLVDPRKCVFNSGCPSEIVLSGGVKLQIGDTFTVVIERFDTFITADVVVS